MQNPILAILIILPMLGAAVGTSISERAAKTWALAVSLATLAVRSRRGIHV
jgi:NADH:ubiquinone oxidoreductase subunit 4 (subunit M)